MILRKLLQMKGNCDPKQPAQISTIYKRKVKTKAEKAQGQVMKSDALDPDDVSFVAKTVRMADAEVEVGRLGSETVHVSSLVSGSFCPRAHVIAKRHNITAHQKVMPAMRIVWALGRAAETHVRGQFIKAHGAGRCMGKWRCKCGNLSLVGFGAKATICGNCGTDANVYEELDLFDPITGVGGHPDLVFITRKGDFRVVEIKSLNRTEFEKLFKAKPDHTLQLGFYVRILRESFKRDGIKGKVTGTVLYVVKDFVPSSPYLEFNGDASDLTLDALTGQAVIAKEAEEEGTTPPRLTACSSPKATRAKNCAACSLCFQLSD
jgi:hypothetical protein